MKKTQSDYAKLLLDPRWQKMRLKVLERDSFTCQACFNKESTLHVHHLYYRKSLLPWEYEMSAYLTLCCDCHYDEKEAFEMKKDLLEALSEKGCLSGDFMHLSNGFAGCTFRHQPGVVISALVHALMKPALQQKIIEWYFDSLGEK